MHLAFLDFSGELAGQNNILDPITSGPTSPSGAIWRHRHLAPDGAIWRYLAMSPSGAIWRHRHLATSPSGASWRHRHLAPDGDVASWRQKRRNASWRQLAVGPKREKISGASNASRWRQIAPDSASWRHFLAPDPKSGARWRSDHQIFPSGARWRSSGARSGARWR